MDDLGNNRELMDSRCLVERALSAVIVLADHRVRSVRLALRRWCIGRLALCGLTTGEVRIIEPPSLDELELSIKIADDTQEVQTARYTIVARGIER